MTSYDRGVALERIARDALVSMGAAVVIRSAGSKGPVDLVASLATRTLAVQCKRRTWPPPADRRALLDLAISTGWEAWACRWESRKPLRWAHLLPGGLLDEKRPEVLCTHRSVAEEAGYPDRSGRCRVYRRCEDCGQFLGEIGWDSVL
jgi:hypothetical protein